MVIISDAKFHFNRLMLTLILASGALNPSPPPPRAWRTTEKTGPDRVNKNCDVTKRTSTYSKFKSNVVQTSLVRIE